MAIDAIGLIITDDVFADIIVVMDMAIIIADIITMDMDTIIDIIIVDMGTIMDIMGTIIIIVIMVVIITVNKTSIATEAFARKPLILC